MLVHRIQHDGVITHEITVIPASGGDATQITPIPFNDMDPDWRR